MRKLYAEAIGTFCLVFAGTGAIVINETTAGQVTHVGIALTFGLVVMAMIYAVGDISGAHLNPAVTLGFWSAGRLSRNSVIPYVLSQLVGAFAASALLWSMFEGTSLGATHPAGPPAQSFVLEAVLTAMLMFVILRVASGPKERGLLAGVAIGGVIAFEALFAGPISGASMNPARSLAPAVLSGAIADVWIYLAAPVLGALIGVLCDRAIAVKRVVFVCVENSNRSQMAEAFAHMLGGVEAHSAGSRPAGKLNTKAIEAMHEVGYDLSTHRSKALEELPSGPFDAVITMGCGDACPSLRARRHENWNIPDPKELPPEEFRAVRDLIRTRVQQLFLELKG